MIDPELLVRQFDEKFNLFHELMVHKVREILLVSCPYDAFVLEEDGSLAYRIIDKYQGLNLSTPPRLTRASTAEDALKLIRKRSFDLVLTVPYVGEIDAFDLASSIKNIRPKLPVVLLTDKSKSLLAVKAGMDCSCIDKTYVWTGDASLLLAIIKNVEDHANASHDTNKAMVRIIILVEDSPDDLSTVLPVLYDEVFVQTQSVLGDTLNEEHRLLKMRARPKILVASSFEEAMRLFKRYKKYVFCIISDTRFYQKCTLKADAGIQLLSNIRKKVPDLPLLLMSSEQSNKEKASLIPAVFVGKNHSDFSKGIETFFLEHLGFGDFVFRLPNGKEVGRAENLRAFENEISEIPEGSVLYHAERNHFSNWIMARSEVGLGAVLSKLKLADFESVNDLRRYLARCIYSFRRWRQIGIVAAFSARDFDPKVVDFVKIGDGSMGGKARGVAFIASQLRYRQDLRKKFADYPIIVPKTCVIANDGFISFVEENKLYYLCGGTDAVITKRFLAAQLPDWLRKDLAAFLEKVSSPMAIRSSSLLEDAQYRPYAGLYNTYMLPNNNFDFKVRLRQLEDAVKMVYASTYFESPRSFSRNIGQTKGDSMAVLIQQLIGRDYNGLFYPAFSGVAQSHNFYPISYMKQEEGIVSIALGFGKTVVDGQKCMRFSPKYPKILPQLSSVDDMLKNTQRNFYALSMSKGNKRNFIKNYLLDRIAVSDTEETYPIKALCSTYLPEEHKVIDSYIRGDKIITFAQLLKYKTYPLSDILLELLELGREGMGCPVEIEFAVDLSEGDGKDTFYLLQIRPLVVGIGRGEVEIDSAQKAASFCYSQQSLGHGLFTMTDIILVKSEGFDQSKSKLIAKEIGVLNRGVSGAAGKYLLIGPGRWGSSDHLLGIPVHWHDISNAGAIIELMESIKIEPSQGTHFFQNITSLGIPYITIRLHGSNEEKLDLDWLAKQALIQETTYLKHIKIEKGFTVKVNGNNSQCVIYINNIY